MKKFLILYCFCFLSANLYPQYRLDLSGNWDFAIDREGIGQQEKWFEQKSFSEKIQLPGSMEENLKGDDITLETRWEGSIYDSSFYFNPRLEKYRKSDNLKFPFFLTPDKHYIGWAWYGKTVKISSLWKGKRIVLYLERPHVESVVWINGKKAGGFMSHCVPHEYDITEFIKSGENRIVIAIDNTTKEINVGKDSHSITDQTQGNWNGIVGKIELRATPTTYINDIQAFPDVKNKKVKIEISFNKAINNFNVTSSLRCFNNGNNFEALPDQTYSNSDINKDKITLYYDLGEDMKLWDEFNPNLYKVNIQLNTKNGTDSKEITFGMREFTIAGKYFYINGKKIMLRGTVENCDFPLTGYAPTDRQSWERIFRICKSFGLNHVRFHSYCPPEAAFEAADIVGMYLQPEGPSWPNHGSALGSGRPVDDYLMLETQRMTKQYGNYASFCMLACGNEPAGNWVPWVSRFVEYWKNTDSRRVYTGASVGQGWAWQPANQYHVKAGARGVSWGARPESRSDFSNRIDTVKVPYVSHETGQHCAFPNFEEIDKYTGVMKAHNFELFQEDLADHDMAVLARKFLLASGKLQVLTYKHEIEKTLRTPGYAGFQLLSLNDYSGQGTALVGVLDVFWDEKGYVSAPEFHRFCSETVPLIRTDKFVYRNNETINADLEFCHFGEKAILHAVILVTLRDSNGKVLSSYEMPAINIPIGQGYKIGKIEFPLASIINATKCNLEIAIKNTNIINDWDFFVYPVRKTPSISNVYETDQLDETAISTLSKGGNVLLHAAGKIEYGKEIVQYFEPVFWNTSWFKMRPPHTTGILINPYHPVFKDFPTDYHSNLQWWEIVHKAQVMQLTDFPKGFQPLIQSIDTWFLNRKIGMLFEANVLNGKLIVCSADLKSNPDNRPAAQQLYVSILNYMQSGKFRPQYTVDIETIKNLFRISTERINTYSSDMPDELKI